MVLLKKKVERKTSVKEAVSFEHVYSSQAASTLTAASFGNSLQKSFSLTRPGWVTAFEVHRILDKNTLMKKRIQSFKVVI